MTTAELINKLKNRKINAVKVTGERNSLITRLNTLQSDLGPVKDVNYPELTTDEALNAALNNKIIRIRNRAEASRTRAEAVLTKLDNFFEQDPKIAKLEKAAKQGLLGSDENASKIIENAKQERLQLMGFAGEEVKDADTIKAVKPAEPVTESEPIVESDHVEQKVKTKNIRAVAVINESTKLSGKVAELFAVINDHDGGLTTKELAEKVWPDKGTRIGRMRVSTTITYINEVLEKAGETYRFVNVPVDGARKIIKRPITETVEVDQKVENKILGEFSRQEITVLTKAIKDYYSDIRAAFPAKFVDEPGDTQRLDRIMQLNTSEDLGLPMPQLINQRLSVLQKLQDFIGKEEFVTEMETACSDDNDLYELVASLEVVFKAKISYGEYRGVSGFGYLRELFNNRKFATHEVVYDESTLLIEGCKPLVVVAVKEAIEPLQVRGIIIEANVPIARDSEEEERERTEKAKKKAIVESLKEQGMLGSADKRFGQDAITQMLTSNKLTNHDFVSFIEKKLIKPVKEKGYNTYTLAQIAAMIEALDENIITRLSSGKAKARMGKWIAEFEDLINESNGHS